MKALRAIPAPVWVLLILSPAVGELLSGSAPPAEFFHPVGFVLLVLLYGVGAVLCREFTVRWSRGWPTLLLLGAAYGVFEEGLAIASFFNPGHADLGAMAGYGRWLGVNWLWSLDLTIYHALISVGVCVALVTLAFPKHRGQAWLSTRTLAVFTGVFLANGLLLHVLFGLFLTKFWPPIPAYLACFLLIGGFIWLARRAPVPAREGAATIRPLWLGLVTFLATWAFFLQMFIPPNLGVPEIAAMALMAASAVFVIWLLHRMAGRGAALSSRQVLGLVSGPLVTMALMAFIQQADNAKRPDNTSGMALVGLVTLVGLIALAWVARRREHRAGTTTPGLV